ncbi:MAG: alginate acetyltransferase [Candidatus Cloacimonadota bacterium]|nr:MAG: alginate acetyltransferase [Candidatus Cloacimonadota bacterium]PIE82050.1 MAG: alginate acetyltransferase [Candidatus Delongbacteria bacterium]
MVFSSVTFLIFFIIVYSLLVSFKGRVSLTKFVLLSSSYFFYGYWNYKFLSLIIFSTILDYIVGGRIYQSSSSKNRKLLLTISMVSNLGLLFFFKYFNFFIESFNSSFGFLGLSFHTLNIILPVGISFYTFQTMSYTIDIYRKSLKPSKSFLDFSIFVAFFPQLVAGPIVRAVDFLPQIERDISISKDNFFKGGQIFLNGFLKKLLIADTLAYFVDYVFANPSVFDSYTIWAAVVAYTIQIFCDFSGYSYMAIGIAKIIGFDLPENFRSPYIALNITQFWRRWHISLSTWLRDYLYISLGGNRKGSFRTYQNLFLTMVLGGLWHGASWNFVIWGGLHGLGLIIHKLYLKWFSPSESFLAKSVSWFSTMLFVMICWVYFRAESFEFSSIMLKKMFVFEDGVHYIYTKFVVIMVMVIISHIFALKGYDRKYYFVDLKSFKGAFILVFALFLFLLFSPINTAPFIYFQF